MKHSIPLILATGAIAMTLHSAEIGFEEEFVLSSDREATLAKLVPGSQEFYFYSCLVAQQKGDFAEVDKLLKQWRDLHGVSSEFDSMEFRGKLLAVDPANAESLAAFAKYYIDKFNLNLNHARQVETPPDSYPASLVGQLKFEEWFNEAVNRGHNLDFITNAGLDAIDPAKLDDARRRAYLSRLAYRPGITDFWRVVLADLRAKDSRGFGSHSVHSYLFLADLDALAKEMPELLANNSYLREYARRLLPDNPAWTLDLEQKRATLARLRAFAETLPASQNSFKAHVFYHALDADRAAGVFDRDLFDAYIRLPRNTRYVRPQWRDALSASGAWLPANLDDNFSDATMLPPVANDEPLVRDLLSRLMLDAEDWRPFAEFFTDDYAKALFAETKLLAGVGNPDAWYALLPPGAHAALRDRVDIALLPDNPAICDPGKPVSLSVAIKNVSRLTIQVFEIDTFHYFRDNPQVDTAIDLDGLSPTAERTVKFDLPPLRRHAEKIEIPEIEGRGLFVVELIGDTGVSSRAVIRRGRLFATTRHSAAGMMFRVFDESLEPARNARVWIKGREFTADDSGEILIPFVNPSDMAQFAANARVLLRDGDFTDSLDFYPEEESYGFSADFVLDREELVPGECAAILITPHLECSGVEIAPSLIESPALEISTFDSTGAGSVRRIPLDALPDNGAIRQEFMVPEGVARVSLRLAGRVRNIALGRDEDVSGEFSLDVGSSPSARHACNAYLRRTSEGAFIEVLGKNGEPFAGRVLHLRFSHRDFQLDRTIVAQTGADGRVMLGALPPDVTGLSVEFDNRAAHWNLATRTVSLPDELSVLTGERIEIPNPAPSGLNVLAPASLSRDNIQNFAKVEDVSSALSIADGAIVIEGLAAGDYTLSLPVIDGRRETWLHVYSKPFDAGLAVRDGEIVETDAALVPRIAAFDSESDPANVRIHVANATPSTRVHLLARWSVSDPLPDFAARRVSGARGSLWPASSLYVSGRTLGDEVRYVLERRFVAAHPGNMLAKPSLLLRPWDTRSTGSTRVDAQGGGEYDRLAAPQAAKMMAADGMGGYGAAEMMAAPGYAPCYDFLPGPALVAENLVPDGNGDIVVERAVLGFRTEVIAMLDDTQVRSAESFALPQAELKPRERALAATLPRDRDVAERKLVTPLAAGEALDFAEASSARYECIDTVGRFYAVLRDFAAESPSAKNFDDFAFVANWADMPRDEKLAAYSKYACHELDIFLYFKDRPFFDEVVAPIIADMHAPDFVNDWLLGRDLSRWLEPAALSSLHSAEVALLARRCDRETRDRLARIISDGAELNKPDREMLDRRFRAILGSDGPSGDDSMALNAMVLEEAADFDGMPLSAAAPMAARAMDAAPRGRALALGAKMVMMAAEAPMEADGLEGAMNASANARRKMSRLEKDKALRGSARAFYHSPERTKEWVESRYYRIPRDSQCDLLVMPAGFWRDAALAENGAPFISGEFIGIGTRDGGIGFVDAMLALALTDLPFKAGESAIATGADGSAKLTAKSPMLVVHRRIETLDAGSKAALPLLVNETFVDVTQTQISADGEIRPRVVTDEFVIGRPYAANVAIVNPTDSKVAFSLLVQVPQGAIPVGESTYTREMSMELNPHTDQTISYCFYFPRPGEFSHYAARASDTDGASATAADRAFNVVAKQGDNDDGSWESVSQRGSDDAVVEFLETHNVRRLDLSLIAFRMRDLAMFRRTTDLLRARGRLDASIWNYAFHHKDAATMAETIALMIGTVPPWPWIDSPLFKSDAVESGHIEHAEYWPLVNARAHELGGRRRILDKTFEATYGKFLRYLAFKPSPSDSDRLATAIYMLLQDRVDDAAKQIAAIDQAKIGEKMQLDYLRAYMAFCASDPDAARKIAAPYADYPVERWSKLFGEILAQADEIKNGAAVADENSIQAQPSLALEEDGDSVAIHYSKLETCVVKYYPMDLELLFSRSPFAGNAGERFAMVRPMKTETVKLPRGKTVLKHKIANDFLSRNVRIEVEGDGVTAGIVHTPHTLVVRIAEAAGQLIATDAKGKPIPAAYVKAYARWKDGRELFYKDGYTDLRGRFDYASLSTDDLPQIERFAILVMTDENGALIREATPPNK